MNNYSVIYLKQANDKEPIYDWLETLDNSAKIRILNRILRLEEGIFGDCKKISADISELRFSFGSGYRIYYHQYKNTIVLLINGGDKSTQSKDIIKAQKLLDEWRTTNAK
ncbi:MAG: type II toxin-antitoxin system RelE/ParE family toxin [Candidatus Gastranaerophilales bacterium]